MGKAMASTSKFAQHKCNNGGEDYFSILPDEILVIILSSLSMREAARSRILSRRWSHLWTMFGGSLDFDGSKTLFEVEWKGKKSLEPERTRFVSWVNLQVLGLHQGPSVGELKVRFDLGDYSTLDVDTWIEFAIRKKIRKLELDLRSTPASAGEGFYAFPSHLVIKKNFALSSLTALRLSCVSVNGEVLEHFLSHSPFLEAMTLDLIGGTPVSFNVSGPSLKLKYLEISSIALKNLEISAKNLVSFKYIGRRIPILFKHVPSLVDVSFGGGFAMDPIQNLQGFSSYFMQLERLSLLLETKEAIVPVKKLELGNLKYLELEVSCYNRRTLVSCIYLLDASPLLREFTLQIGKEGPITPDEESLASIFKRLREGTFTKYQYLKVVELVGRVGSTVVEFIKLVLENVASMEKLIVNPRIKLGVRCIPEEYELKYFSKEKQLAREHAMKLVPELPSGVEFHML